jgi:hypothetical protein
LKKYVVLQYVIAKVLDKKSRWKGGFEDASLANHFQYNSMGNTYYHLPSDG